MLTHCLRSCFWSASRCARTCRLNALLTPLALLQSSSPSLVSAAPLTDPTWLSLTHLCAVIIAIIVVLVVCVQQRSCGNGGNNNQPARRAIELLTTDHLDIWTRRSMAIDFGVQD